MSPTERTARNFVKRRGMAAFRRLITLFRAGVPLSHVGKEFGVSRERARQWRNTFGETLTFYRIYPPIEYLAETPEDPPPKGAL